MRIRASVVTPVLAILMVAALITTGIVLGQENPEEANATLLDSTPDSPAPVSADATMVAGAAGQRGEWMEQPAEQIVPVVDPASAEPGTVTEAPVSSSPPAVSSSPPATTTRPTAGGTDDSTHSGRESVESGGQRAPADHDEDDESDSHEAEDD